MVGVYEILYPPVVIVFVIFVLLIVCPSIFNTRVLIAIPLSSSVSVAVMSGADVARYAPFDGTSFEITGFTFSFTLSFKLLPSALSVSSIVTLFPAWSVAVILTG